MGSVVPTGFPAYVGVLHPVATSHDLVPRRWEDFVHAEVLIYYPLIQWERLGGQMDVATGASPAEPLIGLLSGGPRAALLPHLGGETATPNWFFLWRVGGVGRA